MNITKVPLRISFVGGGTDLPEFYQEHGGSVVSMAIDKYVVVITKKMNPSFNSLSRISYRDVTEFVENKDIKHNFIRDVVDQFKIDFPIEVVTVADLPGGGMGLGASSALLAGCLVGIDALGNYSSGHRGHTLFGEKPDKMNVAEEAYLIERKYRKCGKQDHYTTVYGGVRRYQFNKDGSVNVEPSINDLCGPLIHAMFLRYTGEASDKTEKILSDQSNKSSLGPYMNNLTKKFMYDLCQMNYYGCTTCIEQSWEIKKEFSPEVTNDAIDDMMDELRAQGARGMKVLGSGGGGFIVGFHENKETLKKKCPGIYLDVNVDNNGLTTWRA